MEVCKGLENCWLACLKCSEICTKMCPIEKEEAMEELRQRMRILEGSLEQNIYLDSRAEF